MDRTNLEELMKGLTEEQRQIVKEAIEKTNQNSQVNVDRWVAEQMQQRVNQFVADAIRKYPAKNEKTEYQKIMEGATEAEKQQAAEILRGQVPYIC